MAHPSEEQSSLPFTNEIAELVESQLTCKFRFLGCFFFVRGEGQK